MRLLEAQPLRLGTLDRARRVGRADVTEVSLRDTTIIREVMHPGWRWSDDVRPVVGTDLCRARHQICIVSGRMQVAMEGAELELGAGDAVVIPPGHDAWVVGDEPCEIVDFSPTYVRLIAAGEAHQRLTDPARRDGRRAPTAADVAVQLRKDARAGRLDRAAVEVVLGSVSQRSKHVSGLAGLTPRETQVLVLIATGASARQVAHRLGITPKTAGTHIERIYAKIAVTSRASATCFAVQHGLVDPTAETSLEF